MFLDTECMVGMHLNLLLQLCVTTAWLCELTSSHVSPVSWTRVIILDVQHLQTLTILTMLSIQCPSLVALCILVCVCVCVCVCDDQVSPGEAIHLYITCHCGVPPPSITRVLPVSNTTTDTSSLMTYQRPNMCYGGDRLQHQICH